MDIEHAKLRDGRRLLDAWPKVAQFFEPEDDVQFVSIPEGKRGFGVAEYGDAENHYLMMYKFHPTGESDFVEGRALSE